MAAPSHSSVCTQSLCSYWAIREQEPRSEHLSSLFMRQAEALTVPACCGTGDCECVSLQPAQPAVSGHGPLRLRHHPHGRYCFHSRYDKPATACGHLAARVIVSCLACSQPSASACCFAGRVPVIFSEHAAGAVAAGAAAGRHAAHGRHGAVPRPARGGRDRHRWSFRYISIAVPSSHWMTSALAGSCMGSGNYTG